MQSIAKIVTEFQLNGISVSSIDGDLQLGSATGSSPNLASQVLMPRKIEVLEYLRARDHMEWPKIAPYSGPPIAAPVQELWWNWIHPDASLTLSLIEFIKQGDVNEIAHKVRQLIAQNEALRARFREISGVLTVTLNSPDSFDVEIDPKSSSVSREDLKQRIEEFVIRPLQGGSPWLVRAKVFSVSHLGYVVVIVANHLVVDGSSIDIMRKQLRKALNSAVAEGAAAGSINYFGFAHWQRQRLIRSGGELCGYWRNWIGNQPAVLTPVGAIIMRWKPGRKVRRTFTIPPFAHGAVAKIARENATFPFFVYLTVLSLSIARWSGQYSFPIRCICDGRTRPELVGLVGLMTGADAIHVDVDPAIGFGTLLKDIEREYHAASRLRIPTIYAFPPHVAQPVADTDLQRDNVAIVLNYRKATSHAVDMGDTSDTAWPPQDGEPRYDVWSHVVSPVCLELTQLAGVTTAAFLLHEDVLTDLEQNDLIRAFFAIFGEKVLRADGP